MPSVLKLKQRQCGTWLPRLIRTAVVNLNSMNSLTWWPPAHRKTNQGTKWEKCSSPSTLTDPAIFLLNTWEKSLRSSVNCKTTTPSKKWLTELISIKTASFQKNNSTICWPRKLIDYWLHKSLFCINEVLNIFIEVQHPNAFRNINILQLINI